MKLTEPKFLVAAMLILKRWFSCISFITFKCTSNRIIIQTDLQLISTSWILSFLLVLTTLLQYLQVYKKAESLCVLSTWSRISPFSFAALPQITHCHFLIPASIIVVMCIRNMLSLSCGEGLLSGGPELEKKQKINDQWLWK